MDINVEKLPKAAELFLGELSRSLETKNLVEVARAIILHSFLDKSLHPLSPIIINLDCSTLLPSARLMIAAWRDGLEENDKFDCFSQLDGKWFAAKVLSRQDRLILVHYLGWSGDRFDDWLNIDVREDIFPHTTRTAASKVAKKPRASSGYRVYVAIGPDGREIVTANESADLKPTGNPGESPMKILLTISFIFVPV
jgi:hypothetical protein